MLELKGVTACYGAIRALHDVSLYVDKGEVVALIGSNGAGKSTLLMTIFGNPAAAAGSILFEGKELRGLATHNISRHGIALVPEGRHIFQGMTVEENLVMGAVSLSANDTEGDIEQIYELFPILKERSRQRAGTLSGGEQQMLAIGRGLMARPRLLLLDEPSLGLAPLLVRQIFDILAIPEIFIRNLKRGILESAEFFQVSSGAIFHRLISWIFLNSFLASFRRSGRFTGLCRMSPFRKAVQAPWRCYLPAVSMVFQS